MSKKIRKLFFIVTTMFFLFSVFFFPQTNVIKAASGPNLIDLEDTTTLSGNNWYYTPAEKRFTIEDGADLQVIGTANDGTHIVVVAGATADIQLNNVNLDGYDFSAIEVQARAMLTLNLLGTNTLIGGDATAGIMVPENSVLVIEGTGSLTVTGGSSTREHYGAGIGGGGAGINADCGTIIINSGTVTAYGGQSSAGIGGGADGSGGYITINGGSVTATGGLGSSSGIGGMGGGAGIGGGANNRSGDIKILGTADVVAYGGDSNGDYGAGAGIGTGGTMLNHINSVDSIVIETSGFVNAVGGLAGLGATPGFEGADIGFGGNQTFCGEGFLVYGWIAPGEVTGHPQDETVNETEDAYFSIGMTYTTSTAVRPFAYQWQVSEDGGTTWTNLTNAAGSVSGATTGSLTLRNVSYSMYGNLYRCVLTGLASASLDQYTYYSHPAILNVEPANRITTIVGVGGSITPSGVVVVLDNEDQSFTITADIGYVISDVLIDSVSIGPVSDYTFFNVTDDHTIEVIFALDTAPITGDATFAGLAIVVMLTSISTLYIFNKKEKK